MKMQKQKLRCIFKKPEIEKCTFLSWQKSYA